MHLHIDAITDLRDAGRPWGPKEVDAYEQHARAAADRLGHTVHFVGVGSDEDLNCPSFALATGQGNGEFVDAYMDAWAAVHDAALSDAAEPVS